MNIDLPDEVWTLVFVHLSPKDITHFGTVCKKWLSHTKQSSVWGHLFVKHYRRRPNSDSLNTVFGEFTTKFRREQNWKCGKFSKVETTISNQSINQIESNKDRTLIVTGGDDARVLLLKLTKNNDWLSSLNKTVSLSLDVYAELGLHMSLVWVTHFLNNDEHIISSGYDGCIKLWDVSSRKCIKNIENAHARGVWEIRMKGDDTEEGTVGQTNIFTVGNDGTAKCFDLETGQLIRTISVSTSFAWNLVPLWKENLLITSSQDSIIRLWDYRSGTCEGSKRVDEQLTHLRHNNQCWSHLLVGGTSQGLVSFWDIRKLFSNETVKVLNYSQSIRDICIDGTKFAVAIKNECTMLYFMENLLNGDSTPMDCNIGEKEANIFDITDENLLVGTRSGKVLNYNFDSNSGTSDECSIM